MQTKFSFSLTDFECGQNLSHLKVDRFIPSRSSLQDLDCITSLKQESLLSHNNIPFIENKKNLHNQMSINFERKRNKITKTRVIPKTPFKILDAPYL